MLQDMNFTSVYEILMSVYGKYLKVTIISRYLI